MSDGMSVLLMLIALLILADSYLVLHHGTTLAQKLIGADHRDSRVRIAEGVGWTSISLLLIISVLWSRGTFG
jgi:hypothetical protein